MIMDKVKSNQTSGKRHHEVVVDPKLSSGEKQQILGNLEQDARLLDTATAEGMTGGEPSNLHQVLDAKKKPVRVPAKNPPPGSEAEVEKETQLEKLDP
jgi:hypothetical protein